MSTTLEPEAVILLELNGNQAKYLTALQARILETEGQDALNTLTKRALEDPDGCTRWMLMAGIKPRVALTETHYVPAWGPTASADTRSLEGE